MDNDRHRHAWSTRRRLAVVLGVAPLAALTGRVARAAEAPRAALADYPARNIELIVPFAPGGGVDQFARTIGQLLAEQNLVSRPVLTVNRPGAGGAIGMALLVQRKGDAYTLLGTGMHPVITPLMLGTPHSYRNLTPIAKVYSEYTMMVVRNESPIRGLKDIEAALRKDASALTFGGASLGSPDHITAALFARAVGADAAKINYVPYSGADSNSAVLGGHVDVGLGGLDVITHIEAGRMRAFAVTSPRRLAGRFQKVPTFAEQGYDVVVENWRGLYGPPEMPAAVVQYWRDALGKMVRSAAWKNELARNQWADSFDTDGFMASMDRDSQFYGALLKQLGMIK